MTRRGRRAPGRDARAPRVARRSISSIVGGGATRRGSGARRGVARAQRRAVDAGDFAGETSQPVVEADSRRPPLPRSTATCRWSSRGRPSARRLMRTAPHLVPADRVRLPGLPRREPRACPRWASGSRSTTRSRSGARRRAAGSCRPHELYELTPHLRTAGLAGAMAYVDCQTDDARLVLENVLDAEAAGAAVANHLRAERAARDRRGRVTRRRARRHRDGRRRSRRRARVVLSATGPFTDSLPHGRRGASPAPDAGRSPRVRRRARPARRTGARAPLAARQPPVLRACPPGARTVIGTTDTDWPSPTPAAHRRRHPRARRGRRLPARGGEPRVSQPGPGPDDVAVDLRGAAAAARHGAHTPSETSREHEIARAADGLLVDRGRQADDAAPDGRGGGRPRRRDVCWPPGSSGRSPPCATPDRPLPGGGGPPAALSDAGLPPDVTARLAAAPTAAGRRGRRARARRRPSWRSRIDPELPYLRAEIVHAVARRARARGRGRAPPPRSPLPRRARPGTRRRRGRRDDRRARARLGTGTAARARSSDYRAAVERSRRWRAELGAHRIVMTPSTARSRAKRSSTASRALRTECSSRWLTYLPCVDGCRVVRVLPAVARARRGRGQQRRLDRVVGARDDRAARSCTGIRGSPPAARSPAGAVPPGSSGSVNRRLATASRALLRARGRRPRARRRKAAACRCAAPAPAGSGSSTGQRLEEPGPDDVRQALIDRAVGAVRRPARSSVANLARRATATASRRRSPRFWQLIGRTSKH